MKRRGPPDFSTAVNIGYGYRMTHKPVASALTLELEPVVAENLTRHLATADEWYAHDYVPFEQGKNFAFLGGEDWDPSQAVSYTHLTLPTILLV